MFDQIEKLKQQYTDKYVMIAEDRPELRRFAGYTGQVKTVNMSGQALVEFNSNNNIGWYDINPAFLKLVDKPAEGAPARQVEAAPAKAAATAAGKAAAKPAGGKASTADILAAARANKAAGGAPAAKAPAAAKPAAPAAAKPAAAKPAAGGKMSTADILAAARAKKAGGDAPVAAAPAEEAPAPAAEAPVAKPKAKPAAGGALPTTTAEKIAWMRAHDSK